MADSLSKQLPKTYSRTPPLYLQHLIRNRTATGAVLRQAETCEKADGALQDRQFV
jgi:hypothetical protein